MRAALQVLRRAPRLRHQSTAAAQKTVDDAFLASLEALATTSQSPDVRKLHGDDESHHEAIPPEVVAFPESTEELQCGAHLVPCARTYATYPDVLSEAGPESSDVTALNNLDSWVFGLGTTRGARYDSRRCLPPANDARAWAHLAIRVST